MGRLKPLSIIVVGGAFISAGVLFREFYRNTLGIMHMMTSLAAVIILTYLVFLFFSGNCNPFVKPRNNILRSQWQYARRFALAALLGSIVAVSLSDVLLVPRLHAISTGLGVAVTLALCFSIGRIRQALHG